MAPTYRPFSAIVLISGTILLLGCDGDRTGGLPANPSTKEYKFNRIGVPWTSDVSAPPVPPPGAPAGPD